MTKPSPRQALVSPRDLLGAMLMLACAVGILFSRQAVVERFGRVKTLSDVYALPSPEQTLVMSLGYRAAVADFIYAHTRVAYGIHFQEKRRFEHVGLYLDTVNTLDPTLAEPYLYADTFLTLQPEPPRPEDYDKAREILLRGTRALPYHQELWFVAGQFIAYVAPPHLEDADAKQRWRVEGAKLLARACELASSNDRIPRHCIVAASILNQAGEREALIRMLERTIAVVDDEEVQTLARAARDKWAAERDTAIVRDAIDDAWRRQLPFVPLDRFNLLGPEVPTLGCAGRPSQLDYEAGRCASAIVDWLEHRRPSPSP